MEVDIGDQRNVDTLFDRAHGLGCFHIRNGATNDLAAHFLQLMDLADSGIHVSGVGFSHGLDRNVSSTTDCHPTDIDRLGNSALVHGDSYPNPVIGAFLAGRS